MRRRQFLAWGLGAAACLTGCGGARSGGTLGRVSVVPGGETWTPLAQALSRILGREGVDVAGAGAFAGPGTITRLTVTGLPALAAEINDGGGPLAEGTPLARLVGEPEVLVVARHSRLTGFEDFAAHLVADPTKLLLAGGPQGEADHLLFGLVAQGLGADARLLDYAGYPGPVEAATALLGGRAGVAAGPLSAWRDRIDQGRVRPLAVSSAAGVPGVDAPPLLEAGVRIDFTDWCAVLGPPRMREIDKSAAVEMLDRVVESESWLEACRTRGWRPLPLTGDDFGAWLESETGRTRGALRDLGLLDTTCWGSCGNGH